MSGLNEQRSIQSEYVGSVTYAKLHIPLKEILCDDNTILWISKLCPCVKGGGGVSLNWSDDEQVKYIHHFG